MTGQKKPRVIAFYREHPSIQNLVNAIEGDRKKFTDQLQFLRRKIEQVKKEQDEFSTGAQKQIIEECERLALLQPGELTAAGEHVHYDLDTMTIQRCNHRGGGVMELLGFNV